jgi:hypothetical protein
MLRNCSQDDCEQGSYQHFAEIDDDGHGTIPRLWAVRRAARREIWRRETQRSNMISSRGKCY